MVQVRNPYTNRMINKGSPSHKRVIAIKRLSDINIQKITIKNPSGKGKDILIFGPTHQKYIYNNYSPALIEQSKQIIINQGQEVKHSKKVHSNTERLNNMLLKTEKRNAEHLELQQLNERLTREENLLTKIFEDKHSKPIIVNKPIIDNNVIIGPPDLYQTQEVKPLLTKIYNYLKPVNQYNKGKFIRISGINAPFELRLESVNTGYKKTYTFSHPYHLKNFIALINDDQKEHRDSAGVYDLEQQGEEAWRHAKLQWIKLTAGGCNKHAASEKKLKTKYYNILAHNPQSMNNNCFFECIKYLCDVRLDTKKIRRESKLKGKINISDAEKLIKYLNITKQINANITIITPDSQLELHQDMKYLYIDYNHYFAVKTFTRTKEVKFTKRGDMFMDFETRRTEDFQVIKASNEKIYKLKDTLCCFNYRKYKTKEEINDFFLTDKGRTSARKFIDFLNTESMNGRSYNIIAHNGSRFDYYFIIKEFNKLEMEQCDLNFRGTSIIGINYNGHLFRDSCCFLTDTLSNLCGPKNFNVKNAKMTEIKLHDKIITNEQLCFYRPELTFEEFMELNDPDFWIQYIRYCRYDCISLAEIWKKFTTQMNAVVMEISPYIARKCKIESKLTIGSFAKSLLNEMNKNGYKNSMTLFTKSMNDNKMIQDDLKHKYLRKFTQGGISHNEKGGRFGKKNGIVCYDVKSEYPASMKYAKVPCGKSNFIEEGHEHIPGEHFGFYTITNIEFEKKCFLPVAISTESSGETALNWNHQYINTDVLYIDSFMLEYLTEHCGLLSYKITEGLVSDNYMEMNKLFTRCVDKLYDLKKKQDELLESKDKNYNGAMRAAVKLVLNSMSGKLIENPKNYFSVEFDDEEGDKFNDSKIKKVYREESYNEWLTCGIMVYSHSKRYLYDYLRCIPNKDFIHIETDSIYFEKKYEAEYLKNIEEYDGEFKEFFKVGLDLGNMEKECESAPNTYKYFLGKKMYAMSYMDGGKIKNKFRMKGCPMSTITKDGSKRDILSFEAYATMWEGNIFKSEFFGMKKLLFGKTDIYSIEMTRNLRATNLKAINKKYN